MTARGLGDLAISLTEFRALPTELQWAIYDCCSAHLDEGLRGQRTSQNKNDIIARRRHRELRQARIAEWRQVKSAAAVKA